MANFSVTGVVLTFTLLFFTFPLCYARLRPTSLPENGINIETDFPISLLDSDVNQIIRLPIDESEYRLAEILPEKETGTFEITDMQLANETGNNELATKLPEFESVSEPATVAADLVEKLPVSETVNNEVSEKLPEMETVTVKSMPLGIARFRPVNRPCHHRQHRHHHLFPHSGNMLLPFDRVIIHKQLHRIPQRLSSVPYLHHHHHHHHHHENEESNSMFKRSARFSKEKFNKHFHHHDHHEDHEHEEKSFNMNVKNQKLVNNKDNGLLHRIRKMMINF